MKLKSNGALRIWTSFLTFFTVYFFINVLSSQNGWSFSEGTSTHNFEIPIWGTENLNSLQYGSDKGLNLRQDLFESASENHQVLGYYKARQVLLGQMYLEKSGGEYFVRDVYCQKEFTNDDFRKGTGVGPDLIPDPDVLNTEHTWPQSRFTDHFPKETQKSDLHHLFPTDSEMNSVRSSNKFGEIRGQTIPTKCNSSKFGKTTSGFRFEPPRDHQGNVARAIFYFSIRYQIPIDNDEEVVLRKWHSSDPVDSIEQEHHEMIYNIQGNRNPFVDHPDWVQKISDF